MSVTHSVKRGRYPLAYTACGLWIGKCEHWIDKRTPHPDYTPPVVTCKRCLRAGGDKP